MRVIPVPCLTDNYAYLILPKSSGPALCVDAVTPSSVLKALREHAPDTQLVQCLTTHHHWDHAGGNDELKTLVSGVEVIGGDERVQGLTKKVEHGQSWQVGSIKVDVLGTGCHTRGSVSYVVTDTEDASVPQAVFTGDTLFIGGCGKFFEGSGEDMQRALDRLAALPGTTQVYCGHEYTRSNYKFAASVDPKNEALQQEVARANNVTCTVPSTMATELATNPFMRTRDPSMQQATDAKEPAEVMSRLREMKNGFGGWTGTVMGGVEFAFTYAKWKMMGK